AGARRTGVLVERDGSVPQRAAGGAAALGVRVQGLGHVLTRSLLNDTGDSAPGGAGRTGLMRVSAGGRGGQSRFRPCRSIPGPLRAIVLTRRRAAATISKRLFPSPADWKGTDRWRPPVYSRSPARIRTAGAPPRRPHRWPPPRSCWARPHRPRPTPRPAST